MAVLNYHHHLLLLLLLFCQGVAQCSCIPLNLLVSVAYKKYSMDCTSIWVIAKLIPQIRSFWGHLEAKTTSQNFHEKIRIVISIFCLWVFEGCYLNLLSMSFDLKPKSLQGSNSLMSSVWPKTQKSFPLKLVRHRYLSFKTCLPAAAQLQHRSSSCQFLLLLTK